VTAEQRPRFALCVQEAEKQSANILKRVMAERGPIRNREGSRLFAQRLVRLLFFVGDDVNVHKGGLSEKAVNGGKI